MLENREELFKIDKSKMLKRIESMPNQISRCRKIVDSIDIEYDMEEISHIVICGMGGSAIAGRILGEYLKRELNIPIEVNNNYHIPAHVSEDCLLLTVSYSGNSDEPLNCYEEAKQKRAKIIGLTSDGEMLEKTKKDGFPLIEIPKNMQPREAFGYMFFSQLLVLQKMNLIKKNKGRIKEVEKILKKIRNRLVPKSPKKQNMAKKLAEKSGGSIPVIYGTDGFSGKIAYRWKTQINENAKQHAFTNVFPELAHNEIVGWIPAGDKSLKPIILLDGESESRISKLINSTSEILENNGIDVTKVPPYGSSKLAKMMSLLYLGDFFSYYLAILNERDPTPIQYIETLKKKTAKD